MKHYDNIFLGRPHRAVCASIGFTCAAVLLLSGCGSSGGSGVRTSDLSNAPSVSSAATAGRATLTIKWPARTASRLFPVAANSLRLDILRDGQIYDTRVVARPADVSIPTVVTFDRLPVANLTLRAGAFPTSDGSGVAQASGAATFVVTADAVTDFGVVTMASTITRIDVSPLSLALIVGDQVSLVATAKDANNALVLTPNTLTWSSSSEPTARVDGSGMVTGQAAGTATVTVKETESGKTATVNVSVINAASTISFRTPLSYAAPNAGDVVAADFDGDGNADVAVASGKNILVFYGRGDGTLNAGTVAYNDANDLAPKVAADMNNDGKIDLVYKNRDDKVGVLWNAGNRTFTGPAQVSVGTQPENVAVGDFDGDGYRDIAAIIPGNGPGGNITLAKNNRDGTFTKTNSYGIPGIAIGITAGDINKDGKTDLVATFTTSTVDDSGFLLLIGNGAGGFTSGNRYNTATLNVVSAAIADFNRDTKPDVAVTNYFDNNISVHFGDGTGLLQRSAGYPAAPYPHIMRAADFDYDGWPDLVAANAGTSTFTILRNRRNGLFSGQVTFPSGGNNTRTCDVADFNNDGKPDIVFGNENSNSITIVLNSSL